MPIGAFPHSDCFRSDPCDELLLIQRRQLAKRVNSPLVKNREDFLRLHLSFHAGNLQQTAVYVQVNSLLYNLKRTFWQRLHESATIRLGHDPIIENDDDAAVAFGSN